MGIGTRPPPLLPGAPSPGPPLDLAGGLAELAAARLQALRAWWWRFGPAWEMRRRVMPNGILYIPIDRPLLVEVGGERAVVPPGRLAVMPEGVPQAARHRGRPPRRFDLLCFHLHLADRHGRDLLQRLPRFLPVPDWPGCLPRLRRLAERIHAGGDDGLAFGAIGLRGLLADLVIAAGGLAPLPEPDPRVARCLALIATDGTGRLPVADLAQAAGVGPRRLRDLFLAATGLAPKEHLVRRRIAEATRLLAEPALRVKDVARILGFASDHEFHACFRRVLGVTPTVWRRRPAQ